MQSGLTRSIARRFCSSRSTRWLNGLMYSMNHARGYSSQKIWRAAWRQAYDTSKLVDTCSGACQKQAFVRATRG